MDIKRIYIADDEVNICNIIRSFLWKDGYEVEIFGDGYALLDAFRIKPADMVIIDIMMPEMDGYTLCSSIREISRVPVIFVSAKDTESDKIAGLTLGGDDYLTKPFSPMELLARVKALFRRIEMDQTSTRGNRKLTVGDLVLSPDLNQAMKSGESLNLTGMEFSLLYYLADNRERAISRGELLDKIWGFESEVETRATDDMVKRIRKKLGTAESDIGIETVWGFGFKLQVRSSSYEAQLD